MYTSDKGKNIFRRKNNKEPGTSSNFLPLEWSQLPMRDIALIAREPRQLKSHAVLISNTVLHCSTTNKAILRRSHLSCTLDNALNEPWDLMKCPSCPRWMITNLLKTSSKPLSAKDVYSLSTLTVALGRSVTSKTLDPPQMLAESRAASVTCKEDKM